MQGKNQLINRTGSFGRPNSKGRKTKTSLVFGNLQPKKKKKRVRKIPQSDTEMFSEPCRKHSKDQWAAADRCWLHGHYSFTMILAHKHGTKPLVGRLSPVTRAEGACAGHSAEPSQARAGAQSEEQFSLSPSSPASTRGWRLKASPSHLTPAQSSSEKATEVYKGLFRFFWEVTASSELVCSRTSWSGYQQSRKRQQSLC